MGDWGGGEGGGAEGEERGKWGGKREGRKTEGGIRRWERLWRELEGVWQEPLQLGCIAS